MTTWFAYSTSDPGTVSAYRQAIAARADSTSRLTADLVALGAGPKMYGGRGTTGQPGKIASLQRRDDGHVPDGWQVVPGRRIQPRPGPAGDAARTWLAEHQPVDVRHIMAGHGLPRNVWVPDGAGKRRIAEPELFERDGTLWALYEIEPGGAVDFHDEKCTWTPRTVNEFQAARAAGR
jgi:hypothetical protein